MKNKKRHVAVNPHATCQKKGKYLRDISGRTVEVAFKEEKKTNYY